MDSWNELAARFQLTLPPEDVDCLAQMLERDDFDAEFGVVDDPVRYVHGGMMLPDSLPVMGNYGGDYLCYRFGPDGAVQEVVYWTHEGGGWKPVGRSLAEALASAREVDTGDPVPAEVENRRLICHRALDSMLVNQFFRQKGGQYFADKLGVPWRAMASWLWDTAAFPDEIRARLSRLVKVPAEDLLRQDWNAAAHAAEEVLRIRRDLAWPFAVAGWAAERAGDIERAVTIYCEGIKALGSSEDFTETWAFVPRGSAPKFVAWRLMELGKKNLSGAVTEYLAAARAAPPSMGVHSYWMKRGLEHENAGRHWDAYQSYYRAGCDDPFYGGKEPAEALSSLCRTATQSGAKALAALATLHHDTYVQGHLELFGEPPV